MGTIILIILAIVMTLMFTFGPIIAIAYFVIKAVRNSRKEDSKYIIKVDNVDSIEFEPAKTEKTIKKRNHRTSF